MYVNLLRQKAYHRLTDHDMGKIIGVSRNKYNQKLRNGRFWPNECKAFCMYFNKPFDYLFATEGETVSETGCKAEERNGKNFGIGKPQINRQTRPIKSAN